MQVRGEEYLRVASDDIPLEAMGGRCAGEPGDGCSELSAGTILGIHNVFCVIPQFVMAFASSLIFAAFEHAQGAADPGEMARQQARQIALVLALGGLAASAGAYFAWRLGR
ncbi:hypothetical protein H4R19_006345 [Coemansia spiralis]|nr:hypothetical protein H4R19_006345 [Coemansia spiralis]